MSSTEKAKFSLFLEEKVVFLPKFPRNIQCIDEAVLSEHITPVPQQHSQIQYDGM